ncbi:hypothetical protein EBZ80_15970 [bacterium]|nr:hypothetical protein [bacterium]
MTWNEELVRRSIKILNIGWATVAYFFLALLTVYALDHLFGKFDATRYAHVSTWIIILETLLYLWALGVLIYIVRNLFPLVPFPFDGIMGYDHTKVSEVKSAGVFAAFVVLFNVRLEGYYNLLKNRIFHF